MEHDTNNMKCQSGEETKSDARLDDGAESMDGGQHCKASASAEPGMAAKATAVDDFLKFILSAENNFLPFSFG